MNKKTFETATSEQLAAITHTDGPALVIAGAGTGKTFVISGRIAYLINEHGVQPEQIVALTFTDKAASEMRERVDLLLEYGLSDCRISTFHSFAADLIRRYSHFLNLDPKVGVFNEAEEISFLRQHLQELPLHFFKLGKNPSQNLSTIVSYQNKLKDYGISPEQVLSWANQLTIQAQSEEEIDAAKIQVELAHIYQSCSDLYRKEGVIGYGDLLYLANQLLENHPSIRLQEQESIRYLLVDEYQDTNPSQALFALNLIGPKANIMAVGDDDQAIYGFRGATISNILDFHTQYPGTKNFSLTDNFRSTQAILDSAYTLIQKNNPERLEVQQQINKRLKSNKAGEEAPEVHHFTFDWQEYQWIAEQIQIKIQGGTATEDIAILLRSKTNSRYFQQALANLEIANHFFGGTDFYEQPSIRIVLAFFRFCLEPHINSNLFYLFTHSPFYLDPLMLSQWLQTAKDTHKSLYTVFLENSSEFALLQSAPSLTNQSPSRLLISLYKESGWREELLSQENSETPELFEKLFGELQQFEAKHRDTTLLHYLNHITFLLESEEELSLHSELGEYEGVRIMTIHKSKGLEFSTVFLPHLISSRFPARRRGESFLFPYHLGYGQKEPENPEKNHQSEERRLAYVAFTRAKEHLTLSYSDFYNESRLKSKPSFFLEEAELRTLEQEGTPVKSPQSSLPNQATENLPLVSRSQTKRYSASMLETYLACPQQFYYQYTWHLQTPDTAAQRFGIAVHATLEHCFRQHIYDSQAIQEVYESKWVAGGYELKSFEEAQYERGLTAVLKYISAHQKEKGSVILEHSFSYLLDEQKEMTGKIDRIELSEDGKQAIVVDYKTGEKPMKITEARKSIPLILYTLALERRGIEVLGVRLDYLLVGESVFVPRSDLKVEEVTTTCLETIASIEKDRLLNSFIANPSEYLCRSCSFREICPFRYVTP